MFPEDPVFTWFGIRLHRWTYRVQASLSQSVSGIWPATLDRTRCRLSCSVWSWNGQGSPVLPSIQHRQWRQRLVAESATSLCEREQTVTLEACLYGVSLVVVRRPLVKDFYWISRTLGILITVPVCIFGRLWCADGRCLGVLRENLRRVCTFCAPATLASVASDLICNYIYVYVYSQFQCSTYIYIYNYVYIYIYISILYMIYMLYTYIYSVQIHIYIYMYI